MIKSSVVVFVLFFVCFNALASGMDMGNYLKLKEGARDGIEMARISKNTSLSAIVLTAVYMSAADSMANNYKSKKYFCLPVGLDIDGGDLEGYIDKYIESHPGKVKLGDSLPLISILALQDKFPCK